MAVIERLYRVPICGTVVRSVSVALLVGVLLVGICGGGCVWVWAIRHYLLPSAVEVTLPLNFVFEPCAATKSRICTYPVATAPVEIGGMMTSLESGAGHFYSQLRLVLPVLENGRVGMFIAQLSVTEPQLNRLLITEPRSCLLHRKRFVTRLLEFLLKWPWWVVFGRKDTQTIEVDFGIQKIDGRTSPLVVFAVEVRNVEVQISRGDLMVRGVYNPLTTLLVNWPLCSSLLMFGVVTAWLGCCLLGLFIGLRRCCRRRPQRRAEPQQNPPLPLAPPSHTAVLRDKFVERVALVAKSLPEEDETDWLDH